MTAATITHDRRAGLPTYPAPGGCIYDAPPAQTQWIELTFPSSWTRGLFMGSLACCAPGCAYAIFEPGLGAAESHCPRCPGTVFSFAASGNRLTVRLGCDSGCAPRDVVLDMFTRAYPRFRGRNRRLLLDWAERCGAPELVALARGLRARRRA